MLLSDGLIKSLTFNQITSLTGIRTLDQRNDNRHASETLARAEQLYKDLDTTEKHKECSSELNKIGYYVGCDGKPRIGAGKLELKDRTLFQAKPGMAYQLEELTAEQSHDFLMTSPVGWPRIVVKSICPERPQRAAIHQGSQIILYFGSGKLPDEQTIRQYLIHEMCHSTQSFNRLATGSSCKAEDSLKPLNFLLHTIVEQSALSKVEFLSALKDCWKRAVPDLYSWSYDPEQADIKLSAMLNAETGGKFRAVTEAVKKHCLAARAVSGDYLSLCNSAKLAWIVSLFLSEGLSPEDLNEQLYRLSGEEVEADIMAQAGVGGSGRFALSLTAAEEMTAKVRGFVPDGNSLAATYLCRYIDYIRPALITTFGRRIVYSVDGKIYGVSSDSNKTEATLALLREQTELQIKEADKHAD